MENVTYPQACHLYGQWAEREAKKIDGIVCDPPQPNRTLSEERDGYWYLHLICGFLARVSPSGRVARVGGQD